MRTIPKEITKELIENLYVKEEKSQRVIGLFLKKSSAQVSRYLKRFGIKTRPFSTKGLQPRIGAILSEETKDKIRQKHLGKKLSSEHREKVIKSLNYGRRGRKNNGWKGGKFKIKKGYVFLRKPDHPNAYANGYIPEHRYVIEQKIGRYLGKYEHIHHKNGKKDDNRPENLEIVNGQTHNLITRLEVEVKRLTKENAKLKEELTIE